MKKICKHRHTKLVESGHRWFSPGGAEDDFEEIEVCLDCGITMRDIPQPCLTCLGVVVGDWVDKAGRRHYELECPDCGSSWQSLDIPEFEHKINVRSKCENQGGTTTRTDASQS